MHPNGLCEGVRSWGVAIDPYKPPGGSHRRPILGGYLHRMPRPACLLVATYSCAYA
jgi:hypothetical protein